MNCCANRIISKKLFIIIICCLNYLIVRLELLVFTEKIIHIIFMKQYLKKQCILIILYNEVSSFVGIELILSLVFPKYTVRCYKPRKIRQA